MEPASMSTTISVVLFQRDKWWIAQCLQYDIGAQAHSLPDVLYELERTLVGYLTVADELNIEPFVHLDPAPDFYWKKFQLFEISPNARKNMAARSKCRASRLPGHVAQFPFSTYAERCRTIRS